MTNKIVLIDDNFAIRQVIKIFLTRLSRNNSFDINIFSTDNGVEGLGYVYITNPNIVIVDTTLPKYSGREVLDYFVQNPKFQESGINVIVLHEEKESDLKLPSNFHIISKNQKGSFSLISKTIDEIFKTSESGNSRKLIDKIGNFILINGNKDDLLNKGLTGKALFNSLFNRLKWIWLEFTSSIALTLLLLLYGKPTDENITQQDLDKKAFRSKYYPTLAVTFISSIIILINFGLFVGSQLPLFRNQQQGTTALSTFVVDSITDSSDFLVGDGYCDTDDSIGDGPCTLRAAIEEANSIAGVDYVDFNISGTGPFTINLTQNLPQIISPIIIDGTSQSTSSCGDWALQVEINGGNLYEGFSLNSGAGDSVIQGLVMNGMLNHSIFAEGISNLEILCNVFDFEPDGTTSIPSDSRAIHLQNSIGNITIGDTTTGGNLIGSRLDKRSIEILQTTTSSSPVIDIENNYIGVEKSGQNAPENLSGLSHVYISGDDINSSYPVVNFGGANTLLQDECSGSCNIVACSTGETPSIFLSKTGTSTIRGNNLGVKKTGTSSLTYLGTTSCINNAPGSSGVEITQPKGNVLIGGILTSQRNIIAGFGYHGLIYDDPDAAVSLIINNNIFGTDIDATESLGNAGSNIFFLDGVSTIENNIISGVTLLGDVDAAGLIISTENTNSSIEVFGNYIGTNTSLITNLGNRDAGILVDSGSVGSINIGKIDEIPNYIKYNQYFGITIDQSNSAVNIINNIIEENIGHGIYFYRSNETSDTSIISNNIIKNTKGLNNINSFGHGFASYTSNNITLSDNLFCHDDPDAQNFDYPSAVFMENGNTGILFDGNSIQSQYTSGFVVPWSDTGISIINSNFHTSPQPGVDLGLDPTLGIYPGTTANDAGDNDLGPNNFQNYPEITSVNDETINYSLDTLAGDYLVEFHIPNEDPVCGQGSSLVCTTTITHTGSGTQDFSLNCPALPSRPYDLAAITTKVLGVDQYGDTSELSPITTVTNPTPTPTATSVPAPTTIIPTNTSTPLLPTNAPSNPNPTTIQNTVTPTTISSSPTVLATTTPTLIFTPTQDVTPTQVSTGFFDDFSPGSSYALPESSLLNHPVVKSKFMDIVDFIKTNLDPTTISGKFLDVGIIITDFTNPIYDSINYLLSLQFIGEQIAITSVTAINVFALATPLILTFISEPHIFYFAFFWIWKKNKPPTWGVVLDKVTKMPVAFARIILTQDGKTINTYTTDLQGRYGLDAKKGIYKVFVMHSEYIDESREIVVKNDGEILVLDFQMNPRFHDELQKSFKWWLYSSKIFLRKNLFVLNTIVFSAGFVYTLFAITNSFSVINYAILMLYIIQILMIIIFNAMKEKNLGQVIDINSNEPVKGAVVRLFDETKQIDVTITDNEGRYSFIVDPGTYYIKVNGDGFKFPFKDDSNIVVNSVGDKLLKFTTQDSQKISLKLYVQGYLNMAIRKNEILSPFT
ncbi:carboxypeptidase regulatory-like domain-containing protein [Candidatus Dojkabacteria bacterium]|uniref:Carboxypeptidase regulatory-like domain-containing protein n=1 Tax=Candidatus Dojkabacteria bacterium TaxID=2099670 RepID=A0A955L0X6_9BACT|nr:carboxypeptidase regulatory-like domain-containing protein [Candidatus Dojkabacteria bacterium]